MSCFHTATTFDQIFCCKPSTPGGDCSSDMSSPPKCLSGTIECSQATGGACCSKGTICSSNGCIEINNATVIGTSTATSLGNPVVTVTEQPASTATTPKEGEVGQIVAGAKGFQLATCCVPWMIFFMLISVAFLMNLL